MTQAIGSAATTIGVLTALYIAVIRDPRKASQAGQPVRTDQDSAALAAGG
jgi:hypothetical protein